MPTNPISYLLGPTASASETYRDTASFRALDDDE